MLVRKPTENINIFSRGKSYSSFPCVRGNTVSSLCECTRHKNKCLWKGELIDITIKLSIPVKIFFYTRDSHLCNVSIQPDDDIHQGRGNNNPGPCKIPTELCQRIKICSVLPCICWVWDENHVENLVQGG